MTCERRAARLPHDPTAPPSASLRTFGAEWTNFRREVFSGISPFVCAPLPTRAPCSADRSACPLQAYFIGKDIADLPRQLLLPLCFLSLYDFWLLPLAPFSTLYGIMAAGFFATWGLGTLVSCVLHPSMSQVGAVTFALFWTTVSGSA